MVQQRQLRHSHVDSHYAACIFRYMREYAIICRDFCHFICLDDKHQIKVGEPEVPVATLERGRRVLVGNRERMVVADHDFTKFSLIPSVIFEVKIPQEISGSWYTGQVYVGFKDAIFEPSVLLDMPLNYIQFSLPEMSHLFLSCFYIQTEDQTIDSKYL